MSTPRTPGRPRSADADRAIVEATLDVLMESGVAALAVEQVAARAGVAKATIYRRWANKEALILDALVALDDDVEELDPELPGSSLRDDLLAVARGVAVRDPESRSGRLYAWMVAGASQNHEIAHLYKSRVIERRRERIREVLRRWRDRGELRSDFDLETLLLVVVAPMLVHSVLWHPGEPPAADLVERTVDAVLDGVRARPGEG